MFRTIRTYKSALKENNSSEEIKLYDTSGNNPAELEDYREEVQNLNQYTKEDCRNNLKIYTENMIKLAGVKVFLVTPFLLGGLAIASFVHGKYIKTINVDNIYQDKTIEFDEESLLSESTTTYASTFFYKDYVDESITSVSDMEFVDKSSYATIYYGDGSDAFQVRFPINDDNTWEYSSHTNNLYQKSEKEPIGELDLEYRELIADATETFIKQAELSEEDASFVRELVANNENDIVVKIKKCTKLESANLEVHSYHWLRCLLAVIAEIVLISFIVKNIEDLVTVEKIVAFDGRLDTRGYIGVLKAAKRYREEFLRAEEKRISKIINLLKFHGGDEEILAEYEKRLNLCQKKSKNNE